MSEQDKLTDEVVRDTFQWGATACACCAEYRDEDGVKFDAWLAEHDAKVRAEEREKAAQIAESEGHKWSGEPARSLFKMADRIREQAAGE